MKNNSWQDRLQVLKVGTVAGLVLLCGGAARGQDDDFRVSAPIPPPIRFVATPEKSQLDGEADPKRHARLDLDLAETHLAQAEALTAQQDYTSAAIELADYQGLIHDSITFLQAISQRGNTARDLFKRLEIALRSHCPRLESMRRNTPLSYASNIKEVIRFTEDSRDMSLSCFFGETVLREKDSVPAVKPSSTSTSDKPKQSP